MKFGGLSGETEWNFPEPVREAIQPHDNELPHEVRPTTGVCVQL